VAALVTNAAQIEAVAAADICAATLSLAATLTEAAAATDVCTAKREHNPLILEVADAEDFCFAPPGFGAEQIESAIFVLLPSTDVSVNIAVGVSDITVR
jgi:hypothetical protein